MKEEIKKSLVSIFHIITQYIGCVIIILVIGILIGTQITKSIVEWRMKEAIKVGGFVYENKVYSITEKITH